jgi:hypothetical protein
MNSPIDIESSEPLSACGSIGNHVRCPFCGKWTPCSRENVRFTKEREDDRGTHIEGKNTIYWKAA